MITKTADEMYEIGLRNGLERERPITRELFEMSRQRCSNPTRKVIDASGKYDSDAAKLLAYAMGFDEGIS